MNEINKELQHQIEVMKAQKHIELSGPIDEVNNYIQALSRIYEIAADVAEMEQKLDENNGRNQEIECMIKILKTMNDQNAKAVVVEEWIRKNGPLPNKYGEEVRQILMNGQEE